jgi:ABC-type glycerol-3-phosphate transport system substrate-binding protein
MLLFTTSLFLLISCGGGGEGNSSDSSENRITKINFWAPVSQYSSSIFQEIVNTYNETQGVKDKVFVKYSAKSNEYSNNLSTTLRSKNPIVDVVVITDKTYRGYVEQGYLTDLSVLVNDQNLTIKDDTGKQILDLNDIPKANVDRYRFNLEEKIAGSGTLYGVPLGSNPTVMYYNEKYFNEANINIISINEEDIEEYNTKNGTSFLPHGYAEYDVSATPKAGLKTSENIRGETVVKVFNNRIPMSWNELRTLSMYFSRSYRSNSPSQYGFLSEWWFSFSWSIGGDCIDWDEELNQFVFTLGSTLPNYLVIKDTTINGTSYSAGEILIYKDKKYVAENTNNSSLMENLYQLPSQYEAFREFSALSQVKSKKVDANQNGYEISPSPLTLNNVSRVTYFTSGNVAMLFEEMRNLNTIAKAMNGGWNLAPLNQYREYEGGDLHSDGYLKVIGKTYEGKEYSGEIKKINGVEIVGYKAAGSYNSALAIPQNSKYKEASWKFIQWLAGLEAQKMLAQANEIVPNQTSYILSEEFNNAPTNIVSNYGAAGLVATYNTIGDWGYLEDGEWVHYWANILNTDVRNGSMSLDKFFDTVDSTVNHTLAKYVVRMANKL